MIAYIKIIIIKIKIISLNRNEEINENKFYVSKKSKIKFSSVRCSFDRSFVLNFTYWFLKSEFYLLISCELNFPCSDKITQAIICAV